MKKYEVADITTIPESHHLNQTIAEWSVRVPAATGPIAPVGLWGDSGSFNKDDTLFTLYFSFWLASWKIPVIL